MFQPFKLSVSHSQLSQLETPGKSFTNLGFNLQEKTMFGPHEMAIHFQQAKRTVPPWHLGAAGRYPWLPKHRDPMVWPFEGLLFLADMNCLPVFRGHMPPLPSHFSKSAQCNTKSQRKKCRPSAMQSYTRAHQMLPLQRNLHAKPRSAAPATQSYTTNLHVERQSVARATQNERPEAVRPCSPNAALATKSAC